MASPSTDEGDSVGSIDDDRLVAAVRAAPQPVVNTRYLANEFDVATSDLVDRLHALVESGRLEHLEVVGEGHFWWLSLEEELAG